MHTGRKGVKDWFIEFCDFHNQSIPGGIRPDAASVQNWKTISFLLKETN